MALDVAEFLWNKFLKSLAELESESSSGFVTAIPFFNSSLKNLVSNFKSIRDVVIERDLMSERFTYSKTIDLLYELNDALAESRIISHECKEIKNKLSSLNPRRVISLTAIKEKLKTIEDKLYKLASSPQEIGLPLVMTGPMLTPEVFGFEKQSEEIEDLLLGGSSSGSSSSSVRFTEIGLVGMAGVGKTTLVRKVLESKEVKNKFDRILWLPFSGITEREQQYSRFTFETCILNNLGETEARIVGLDNLLEKLGHLLSDKSYLIVLDDVCFQLINIMERLVSGLPKGSGGAVIVTTRLKEVAQKLGEHHHFVRVKPLPRNSCSSIFEETIENEKKLSSISLGETLEKIKEKMKDQCHGLPLVAKALAQIIPETLELLVFDYL